MNIQKYLERIGINEVNIPDFTQLARLQQRHLLHVPFENLDIHLGKKIILDFDAIYQKVVFHKRGGFCYELNGLFYLLLEKLGYSVKRISARVKGSSGRIGAEGDHLAIIGRLDDQDWLIDVGFGKFSFLPLKISLDEVQSDGQDAFRISKYDETYHGVFTKEKNEDWRLGYLFTMDHRDISYFKEMCDHHQTSPDTNFTKRRMITIPTEQGRMTLTDSKLKIAKNGTVTESEVGSKELFCDNLKTYFQMNYEY